MSLEDKNRQLYLENMQLRLELQIQRSDSTHNELQEFNADIEALEAKISEQQLQIDRLEQECLQLSMMSAHYLEKYMMAKKRINDTYYQLNKQ